MSQRGEDAIVTVRLKPRASADRIEGEREGVLAVRVKAPPVDGRANTALVRLVAKRLGRAPSSVELIRGQRGKEKQLLVAGCDAGEARQMLVGGDE